MDNIGDVIINISDFMGRLTDLITGILFYQIPGLNTNVLNLIFVLGVVGLATILIIKVIR